MMLLGCKPEERLTEQHDICFAIGSSLRDVIPQIEHFWPEGKDNLHIDIWREVSYVDGHTITVVSRDVEKDPREVELKLFFLNLGGYKENDFEEYHYKILCLAQDKSQSFSLAKETAFYKHTGFKSAPSHLDDKYGVDVDDIYNIEDILPETLKDEYRIQILPTAVHTTDSLHAGYLKLSKII